MFKYIFRPSTREHESTIRRQDLVRIVDNCVDRAVGIRQDIADQLRRKARTCDAVDYNAWACRNSCGCPLTQIGVAHVSDTEANANIKGLPNELGSGFYGRFDSSMTSLLGGSGRGSTARVID